MYYFDDETCYWCRYGIDPEYRKKFVDEEEDTTLYFCSTRCLIDFENEQMRKNRIARHRACNWELGE